MVYVPGITRRLYPRKGGGGGGKGGGSIGGGGGGESGGGSTGKGGSSGGSSTGGRSVPLSGSTGGSSGRSITAYGRGGGSATTIPSGQPFAGRSVGGGTRDQVFGTRVYGSGYPGQANRGVTGLNFPFVFWPIVWGGTLGYGAAYLHDSNEYGDPSNSSRPGGPMTQAAFSDANSNNTFHLLADNATVASLIDSVAANCSLGNTTALTPMPLNTSDPSQPRPEQAVQYYRASSVVLTLDGYNDTAALTNDSSIPDTPLPTWVDGSFLDCLNQTIGAAVPLVDSSNSAGMAAAFGTPTMSLLGLIWVLVVSSLVA
ncbi:hypothetical protein PsYK624_014680 [Phanerochaete sordida]|uniref:Uncharacterized protein n=1 Tax=Phanerochaete sordida TaxID=48140 RepID=A0A9P3L8D1_9APHY|nr:hypothetical protein PsYK624_014680 [Phanerochaete sordida]